MTRPSRRRDPGAAGLRRQRRRGPASAGTYELLAQHAPDVVLFLRCEDGRILEASASAVEAYGRPREQLLGLTILDMRAHPSLGPTIAEMSQADARGIVFETTHRRGDGSTFPVEVSSRAASFAGERILVSVVRDVSARKRDEDALVRARAHLQTIVDNIAEGVIVADLEGNPLEWNEAAVRMHGLASQGECPRTRAEMLSTFVIQGEDGSVLAPEQRPLARVIAGEHLQDLEVEVHRSGQPWTRSFSYAGRLVRDGAGQPSMAIITVRDTTERKTAARRLAAERERLAVTLGSIGDGVIATDEQARVTILNDAAARMTGWSAAEAAGRPIQEVFRIVDEETRRPAPNPLDRVIAQGAVVGLANHTTLVARDGRETPVADSGAPIRDADGRIGGAVLVFRDQSEERRAQAALRASEERFRLVFETIPDAVSLSTLAGGEHQVVNEGFTRMLGWSAAETVGRSSTDLGIWAAPEQRARLVAQLEQRGSVHDFEADFQAKDGRILPGLVSARIVELRGERLLLTVKRDLTERRRAEAEGAALRSRLQQTAKLEAIGQLAGGIAHDFNNLLTVILGGTDELRRGLLDGQPEILELVDEVAAAGARARELTRQLLTFARKQHASPISLDLGAAIRGCERLLRRILGEDVAILVSSPPDLWTARCDPGQFEQVILNLAVNARDAMPGGGSLTLALANLAIEEGGAPSRLAGIPPGEYVQLLVRDSGCGMAPEVRERIFEPFFTTKGPGKGSGLGLASVYGIVKQSAGFLSVQSEPGAGTTFEICLPRAPGPEAAARPTSPEPRAAGSERVLLVEDDPNVRNVIARTLRGAGYRVVAAADAFAAVCAVREQEPPAVVVTDVVMPGLSGLELAEHLRRHRPGLKMLFISGYAADALARDGAGELPVEILSKPFTAAALLSRVRALIDEA